MRIGPVLEVTTSFQHSEKTAYIQARSSMARALEVNGKACEAEGKAKVV